MSLVLIKKSINCGADIVEVVEEFLKNGGDLKKDIVTIQVVDEVSKTVFHVFADIMILKSGRLHISVSHPDMVIGDRNVIGDSLKEGHVKIPKSIEEARAMKAVAEMYLNE